MTSLSEQLRRLALPGTVGTLQETKRPSLLFDPKKAATLDRDTFYALGINGLDELSSIDPSLHSEFFETFFSEAAKNTERTMLSQEGNKELDAQIQNFLYRIGPYFLLRPAQKCLEWMIYRFRIHAFNVDEILSSFLPYHETNLFVKLVQMLDISHPTNKWCWIAPIQGPGVTLAKSTISTHCTKDTGFLYFVCNMVTKAIKSHSSVSDPSVPLRTVINFYTSVILSAINTMDKISDHFLSQLIPFVAKGLKSKVLDYKAATYMIICQIAVQATLTEKVVNSLLKTICKHRTLRLHKEILTTVIVICQCQQSVKSLPKMCFEELSEIRELLNILEGIHKTSQDERFLQLFLERLIPATYQVSETSDAGSPNFTSSDVSDMESSTVNLNVMLMSLIEKFEMSSSLQKLVVRLLVEGFIESDSELSSEPSKVIQRVQRKYPEAFDNVVADLMKQKYSAKANPAAAQRLNKFISLSMESARHQVCSDGNASLVLSLVHPEAAIRISAIQHFSSVLPVHPSLTGSDFIRNAVKYRLSSDDSAAVVLEVLKLVDAYPDVLFYDLDSASDLLIKLVYKNRKEPEWNDISLAALTLLTGKSFACCTEDIKHKISVVILDIMLQDICIESEASAYNIAVRSSYMENSVNVLFTLTPNMTVESMTATIVKKLESCEDPADVVSSLYTASQDISHLLYSEHNQSNWKMYLASHYVIIDAVLLSVLKNECSNQTDMMKTAERIISNILRETKAIVSLNWTKELGNEDDGKSQFPQIAPLQDVLHTVVNGYKNEVDDHLLGSKTLHVLFSLLVKVYEVLAKSIQLETKAKNKNGCEYWDSPDEEYTQGESTRSDPRILRFKVFSSLLDFMATFEACNSEISMAVKKMLQIFLTSLFSTPEDVLLFLAPFWTSHCLGYGLQPVSQILQVQTLYLANSLLSALQSGERVVMMESPTSTIVTCLVTALTSPIQAVRKASLICLGTCMTSDHKFAFKELIEHLVNHRQEIEADSNALMEVMCVFFSLDGVRKRKSSRKAVQILDTLLKHQVCSDTAPTWVRATLLKHVLKKVNNQKVALSLVPILKSLLDFCLEAESKSLKETSMDDADSMPSSPEIVLSSSQAVFLLEGLRKIDPGHLEHEKIKSVFMSALSCNHKLPISNETVDSPQINVLGMITKSFFAKLSSPVRQEVLCKMLDVGMGSQLSSTVTAISKAFKAISLDSQHVITELKKILEKRKKKIAIAVHETKRARIRKDEKKSDDNIADVEGNQATSNLWKRTILLLELLQHKKKISNLQALFLPLFEVLEFVLENSNEGSEGKDDSALETWEYVKQLILTTLLNCFQRIKSDSDKPLLSEHCKVEILVQCIRSSANAQTQQHTLLLLSHVATLFPERVLHSVMAIFTFMGTHLLRQDDAYSFQVISTTVHTIIPALMKSKMREENNNYPSSAETTVLMIIRVFVDSLPHIPAHRRLTVFEELLNILGEREHLWITLVLLVDQYSCKPSLGKSADDMDTDSGLVHESEDDDMSPFLSMMEIWCAISDLFSPQVQIDSLIRFVEYILELPEDVENLKKMAQAGRFRPSILDVIGVALHTNNQLRKFRLSSLSFFAYLLGEKRSHFAVKVDTDIVDIGDNPNAMDMDDSSAHDAAKMTVLFQKFFEKLLDLIHKAVENSKTIPGNPTEKYYKVLIHKTYEVMQKVNFLLPMNTFLLIIKGLLHHRLISTRRKAVELLAERINFVSGNFQPEEVSLVLELAEDLMQVAAVRTDESSPDKHDQELLRYSSLVTLKLIIRSCGKQNLDTFVPMLTTLGNLVTNNKDENIQNVSGVLLCLAELCTSLKAYCIAHLNCFVPSLLQMTCTSRTLQNEMLLFSCVTVIHRLLENLANFLSPYLEVILSKVTSLSLLSKYSDISEEQENESSHNLTVMIGTRLKVIHTILATKIPSRILVPALQKCREKAEAKRPMSIVSLSSIVHRHVASLDKEGISQNGAALVAFFMDLMDFRTRMHQQLSMEEIHEVENGAVEALIAMMLKLSETAFRPLYFKLFDWACLPENPSDRLITFYKLMNVMSEKMKGLFALFAGHLLNNIAEILKVNSKSDSSGTFPPNEDAGAIKQHILLCSICDTLHNTMLYDTSGFITRERFELLLHPLVNQLDCLAYSGREESNELNEKYVNSHVIPCLGQLAASISDDICWKPFNYQILLKSRHNSPKVRYASLDAIQAVAEKLGEDYTILLPESIPFLAELMEDDEEVVEKKCHEVIRKLEKVLGEPLQKYF